MASNKITQAEANRLLDMVKRTLVSEINFPSKGKLVEFNVLGNCKQDVNDIFFTDDSATMHALKTNEFQLTPNRKIHLQKILIALFSAS